MTATKRTRTLPAACSIVALAAMMAGCGSTSTTVIGPEPPTLDEVRAAAMAAAAAARTASGRADTAAGGAEAATMRLATLQTGGVAKTYATDARTYADAAMAESRKAGWASDAAAAAADPRAAALALIRAEDARTAAGAAAEVAAGKAMRATQAAPKELAIDGTVTSVGATSIDTMAGATLVHPVPGGDGAVRTGLIRPLSPMATGAAVTGAAYVAPIADDRSTAADETRAGTAYRQAVAARTFSLGKTLDSADDTARLMLVTHYAGSRGWRVFAPPPPSVGIEVTSTKAGWLSLDPITGRTSTDAAYAHNTPLTSVGMYLPAGAADGVLVHSDTVAADARPVEVFSYTDPSDGTKRYATLTATVTTYGRDAGTSWIYTAGADVTAPAAGGTPVRQVRVAADVPSAIAYRHLQFGVWAALGEAARDGGQRIAGPGIGFVQRIGDAMAGADMPTSGTAGYEGNWVAAVRAASPAGAGGLSLAYGPASLTARFAQGEITARLTGLATLEGSIDAATFSGTRAAVAVGNRHGLASGGTFTGEFRGGFHGAGAAEAGGIFDFTSKGGKAGEFRGAFGAVRRDG